MCKERRRKRSTSSLQPLLSVSSFASDENPFRLMLLQRKARQASERDHRYQNVMRSLVRRYITAEQRTAERQRGVTEDDCNEIKQDISALRFELIEILGGRLLSGAAPHLHNVPATGDSSTASLMGKRGRKRERRLLKGIDFNFLFMDTTTSIDESDVPVSGAATAPDPKSGSKSVKSPPSKNKFVRLARGLAGKRGARANKWKQLIEATRSKVIPFSRSSESVNSIGQPKPAATAGTTSASHECESGDGPLIKQVRSLEQKCDDTDWKTQDEDEDVEGRMTRKPDRQLEHHQHDGSQRRHSQLLDYDLNTKRCIFARKTTTLIKDLETASQRPVSPTGIWVQSPSEASPPGPGRPVTPSSSRPQTAHRPVTPDAKSPLPRLMVTLPIPSEKSEDVNKHSKNWKRKKKATGSPRSRSRSPSKSPTLKSPSKSPSPQSLNASVLIGLTQVRRPRNEWI